MNELKRSATLINKKMGANLKAARKEANYTMRALAANISTPHSFIGKVEQQNRRVDVGEFICYCQALGKDPATMLRALY